jgi:exopolyphosphatase/guanosine-5'-triphosphate,3'-diphosphate pyrophosphatase
VPEAGDDMRAVLREPSAAAATDAGPKTVTDAPTTDDLQDPHDSTAGAGLNGSAFAPARGSGRSGLTARRPDAVGGPRAGAMRLGVIDIGSNTAHLLVVDAHPGGQPLPAASIKEPLRLMELLDGEGALLPAGVEALTRCVDTMREHAAEVGVDDLVAFATSALRDAANGEDVLRHVRETTGVDLVVLPGEDEARLTFLAVRRWFGWSAGRLLALDIGGGSLEVAAGLHEDPDVVASLPLGASRLTRDWLPDDPPRRSQVVALRRYVRACIAPLIPELYVVGDPTRAVATSKTFRSLARVAGAEPYSRGPYVRRVLRQDALSDVTARICRLTSADRAGLPGVSAGRAHQLAAGAVVAEEVMRLLGVDEVEICPWALREGVILRRLDWLTSLPS